MIIHRRRFLSLLTAPIVSPAIVRASSLMPVSVARFPGPLYYDQYTIEEMAAWLEREMQRSVQLMLDTASKGPLYYEDCLVQASPEWFKSRIEAAAVEFLYCRG